MTETAQEETIHLNGAEIHQAESQPDTRTPLQKKLDEESIRWPQGGAPIRIGGKNYNLKFGTKGVRWLEKKFKGGNIDQKLVVEFLVVGITACLLKTFENKTSDEIESMVEDWVDALPVDASDQSDNIESLLRKLTHCMNTGMPKALQANPM